MGAAAAVVIHKEKKLVALFRQARALSPDTARSLAALGADQGVGLRRLRRCAVIREAGPGLFYLDQPSWTALTNSRRRIAVVLLTVFLGLAAAWALGLWRS